MQELLVSSAFPPKVNTFGPLFLFHMKGYPLCLRGSRAPDLPRAIRTGAVGLSTQSQSVAPCQILIFTS